MRIGVIHIECSGIHQLFSSGSALRVHVVDVGVEHVSVSLSSTNDRLWRVSPMIRRTMLMRSPWCQHRSHTHRSSLPASNANA
jgi:hypothetical protein